MGFLDKLPDIAAGLKGLHDASQSNIGGAEWENPTNPPDASEEIAFMGGRALQGAADWINSRPIPGPESYELQDAIRASQNVGISFDGRTYDTNRQQFWGQIKVAQHDQQTRRNIENIRAQRQRVAVQERQKQIAAEQAMKRVISGLEFDKTAVRMRAFTQETVVQPKRVVKQRVANTMEQVISESKGRRHEAKVAGQMVQRGMDPNHIAKLHRQGKKVSKVVNHIAIKAAEWRGKRAKSPEVAKEAKAQAQKLTEEAKKQVARTVGVEHPQVGKEKAAAQTVERTVSQAPKPSKTEELAAKLARETVVAPKLAPEIGKKMQKLERELARTLEKVPGLQKDVKVKAVGQYLNMSPEHQAIMREYLKERKKDPRMLTHGQALTMTDFSKSRERVVDLINQLRFSKDMHAQLLHPKHELDQVKAMREAAKLVAGKALEAGMAEQVRTLNKAVEALEKDKVYGKAQTAAEIAKRAAVERARIAAAMGPHMARGVNLSKGRSIGYGGGPGHTGSGF